MAIPIFPAIAGIMAYRTANHASSAFLSGLFSPAEAQARQLAWERVTNALPSPDILYDVWHRGIISDSLAKWGLERNGIDWVDFLQGARNKHQQVWAAYKDGLYVTPDIATILLLYHRRMIDNKTMKHYMKRAGAMPADWHAFKDAFGEHPTPMQVLDLELRNIINGPAAQELREVSGILSKEWNVVKRGMYVSPNSEIALTAFNRGLITEALRDKILADNKSNPDTYGFMAEALKQAPDPALVYQLRARGMITEEIYEDLVQDSNAREDSWAKVADSLGNTPTIGQIVQMRNRNRLTDQQFDDMLKEAGLVRGYHREVIKELREEYPPLSDLITFAVKEVFDAPVANKLRLYDEVPENLRPYFNAQGLHGKLNFNITSNGKEKQADWLDMYWGAHWYPISPSQAYEMLHRLRPERVARYQREGFKVDPFTIDDVRRWLKIADYPPEIRDYLAAVSYNPMRLIDIRNAYMTDVKDEAWAKAQLMDRGLHPDDADTTVALMQNQKQDRETTVGRSTKRKYQARFVESITKNYKIGLFTEQDAINQLMDIGFEEDDARFMIKTVQLEIDHDVASKALNAIKRNYMNGGMTTEKLKLALEVMEVSNEAVLRYAHLWEVERSVIRRVATTERVMRWFSDGLITENQAYTRLTNLGWKDADALLYVADAKRGVLLSQAKQMAALNRSRVAAAKELAKQQKELQAQKEKVEGKIRQLTPLSQMKKWLEKGLLTEKAFRVRLRAMGYTPAVVNLHFSEVMQKVQDAAAKKREKDQA